ncbi:MAG: L-seryl-tRNA(Sec) selenium transferase [Bdellovibrionales bacterium]|nr:L-seryl-tRNA(Sec) selenium transferase [Bdellovibrionales bacterium]
MDKSAAEIYRSLPQVSAYLDSEVGRALSDEFGQGVTKLELRRLLEELRQEIKNGRRSSPVDPAELQGTLRTRIIRLCRPEGRAAINATGVVLHTGLGRSPLSRTAREAMQFEGYSIVQLDLETGGRSVREHHIEAMLRELTGCEAATIVNNNAAATFLVLNELGAGREMIISRGQLIEIGGSFRMPVVMEQSGTVLREVGTTNRTHLKDYEAALSERTAAILHVHPSNYAIRGFSSTPSIAELVELGAAHNVPVIADLGSGAIVGLSEFGLKDVTTIAEALRVGALVTCSSGDKLICGPQAGLLCGSKDVIERLRKNPFARMFRVDKCTLAAMEATLAAYVNGTYREEIPLYRMLSHSVEDLETRAQALVDAMKEFPAVAARVETVGTFVGGGSLPDESVPSRALRLALCPTSAQASSTASDSIRRFAQDFSHRLRVSFPSVICRVSDDACYFDLRTVFPEEDHQLLQVLRRVLSAEGFR